MGFFSWLSSKSGKSIPAYPYAGRPKALSEVVLVLPDDRTIKGTYGGYGDITTEDGKTFDVYEEIAKYLPGYDGTGREYVFNRVKLWTSPDGKKEFLSKIFLWDDVISELGMTQNQMRKAGWTYVDNFTKASSMIKIILRSEDEGEKYADLKTAESCPDQGCFYEMDILDADETDEEGQDD
jgi:hypothetical protein